MKKILLTLLTIIALGFTSNAQVNVSWLDANYTGYYVVKIYVQLNDGSSPFMVGERKNVSLYSASFLLAELQLPTVIVVQKDYYKYIAVVYRQSDPTHYGQNNSGWLDSDEFLSGATIPQITIN